VRRFTVEVSERAFERLVELAVQERRPVRDQAAVVIEAAVGLRAAPTSWPDPVARLLPIPAASPA